MTITPQRCGQRMGFGYLPLPILALQPTRNMVEAFVD